MLMLPCICRMDEYSFSSIQTVTSSGQDGRQLADAVMKEAAEVVSGYAGAGHHRLQHVKTGVDAARHGQVGATRPGQRMGATQCSRLVAPPNSPSGVLRRRFGRISKAGQIESPGW